MEILNVIETLGVPVAVSVGLGYALMYLIRFLTRDVQEDIKNLHDITVKLIDSNREAKDETKKTLTAMYVIKDIMLKLFKGGK
tara:strand:+ start:661 stop:909 length:249 start_codon:yes stop_codon:yes gene_type:complete